MALVGADGNPIAAPNPGPAPPAAAQPLIDVNQLRTAFGTPRADIPIFYGDSSLDIAFILGLINKTIKMFRLADLYTRFILDHF